MWLKNRPIPKEIHVGAEIMSSYYALYLYYLQTQVSGLILAPHIEP